MEIEEYFRRQSGERCFQIGKQSYPLDEKTLVMGILNVTPDSFYDGGKHADVEKAVAAAIQMERDGADLIDLGAESTRPGADPVPAEKKSSVCVRLWSSFYRI
jgi:dihydropteroate synthase